jgi:hypothetical protein
VAFAFDSLGYAKKLREVGVPQDQAEAHAEAAREFIMTELATQNDILAVRHDFDTVRRELQAAIDATRHDLDTVRRELEVKMDNLGLRLTVRMGIMLAAGLSLLGAVLKLHP